MKYLAQKLSNKQSQIVELFSFGWTGANDLDDRRVAGEELAQFIQEYLPSQEYRLMTVAHSHGGNVVNKAANLLEEIYGKDTRPIEYIVNLATPGRADFLTKNFGTYINIYSEQDMIQYAGSFQTTLDTVGNFSKDPRKLHKSDLEGLEAKAIYNVRITDIDGDPLGTGHGLVAGKVAHSEVTLSAPIFPKLFKSLLKDYHDGGDFDLSILNMTKFKNHKTVQGGISYKSLYRGLGFDLSFTSEN